jgi:hypothetical protein
MVNIDEKINQYLTEESRDEKMIDVEDSLKSLLLKYQIIDCCATCFYSMGGAQSVGRKTDMTCENPEVGTVLTGEKYHGQYSMSISPEGKCKYWKQGRRVR